MIFIISDFFYEYWYITFHTRNYNYAPHYATNMDDQTLSSTKNAKNITNLNSTENILKN